MKTAWISTKDRLPNHDEDVLVRVKSSSRKKDIHICTFQKRWRNRRNIFSIASSGLPVLIKTLEDYIKFCVLPLRQITHWAPLPQEPEE